MRKAIAINADEGKVTDLFSLAIAAKKQAERILHHTRFRILPSVEYHAQYQSYTVLVEYEAPAPPKSFGSAMDKLKVPA